MSSEPVGQIHNKTNRGFSWTASQPASELPGDVAFGSAQGDAQLVRLPSPVGLDTGIFINLTDFAPWLGGHNVVTARHSVTNLCGLLEAGAGNWHG